MKRVHYTDNYLINPSHPVTVDRLAGTDLPGPVGYKLTAFGHPGLHVTVCDPDQI